MSTNIAMTFACRLSCKTLCSAGDVVNEDDILLQIETDKVTIDVRYTEAKPGKIKEFLVSEDDTVSVGQQVCIIDKGNTEGEDLGGPIIIKKMWSLHLPCCLCKSSLMQTLHFPNQPQKSQRSLQHLEESPKLSWLNCSLEY